MLSVDERNPTLNLEDVVNEDLPPRINTAFTWLSIGFVSSTLVISILLGIFQQTSGREMGLNILFYLYYVSWLLRYYPQVFMNIRRGKSVGVNIDYMLWFLLSSFLDLAVVIAIHYFGMASSKPLNSFIVYEKVSQTIFSLNAVMAILSIILQMLCLDGLEVQRPSPFPVTIIFAIVTLSIIFLTLFSSKSIDDLNFPSLWLQSISVISAACSIFRFYPQLYCNNKYKCFVGIDIGTVTLDLIGAVCLTLYLFYDACITKSSMKNCLTSFLDAPVTLVAAILIAICDVLLLSQFCLYYDNFATFDLPDDFDDNDVPHSPTAYVDQLDDSIDTNAITNSRPSAPPFEEIDTIDTIHYDSPSPTWKCFRCTLDNHNMSLQCEACEMTRDDSIRRTIYDDFNSNF